MMRGNQSLRVVTDGKLGLLRNKLANYQTFLKVQWNVVILLTEVQTYVVVRLQQFIKWLSGILEWAYSDG